jgi:hypothetical protein
MPKDFRLPASIAEHVESAGHGEYGGYLVDNYWVVLDELYISVAFFLPR